MALSAEMRRLQSKWNNNQGWPKRLEWIEIFGIRGWLGEKIEFQFPIVALIGENGSGKSTVLQAAAAVYRSTAGARERYASEFFPDTPFERIEGTVIRFSYREGTQSQIKTIRKPTGRWRGNPERPERNVQYIDLSRIQPVGARVGYAKLLKAGVLEGAHAAFDAGLLGRFSQIMGRTYSEAGISVTNVDARRQVPVVRTSAGRYSGFHQGAGEIAAAELLAADLPPYSLVLIDEIETSLHPRAQRRLMRDLARLARERDLQIILSTHSPYVLEELPPEGRIYFMKGAAGRTVVTGVSPDFAMTRMDEEQHPECDIYVEDPRAATLVSEILIAADRDLASRAQIIPFGSASVGAALGMMVSQGRFPRPSLVYLDGDQTPPAGCRTLPGDDAPERVVFGALATAGWPGVAEQIRRGPAETIDALNRSMTVANHHLWLQGAANELTLGTDILWHALATSWVANCLSSTARDEIALAVRDALDPPTGV